MIAVALPLVRLPLLYFVWKVPTSWPLEGSNTAIDLVVLLVLVQVIGYVARQRPEMWIDSLSEALPFHPSFGSADTLALLRTSRARTPSHAGARHEPVLAAAAPTARAELQLTMALVAAKRHDPRHRSRSRQMGSEHGVQVSSHPPLRRPLPVERPGHH